MVQCPNEIEFRHAGPSMLALLGAQHAVLTGLAADRDQSSDVASVLVAALCRHLSAEEQYLLPAVRALPDGTGAALAERELLANRELRAAAYAPDLPRRLADHVRRCDDVLFPALARSLDKVALIRLGNRVEIAMEAAPSRPHRNLPATPPLNKLTDPLVGAFDKIRDVVTARTTYPEDL
jgi:hypothetical protein